MTHVAVLKGGIGDEFSVSLKNGIAAIDLLRDDPSYTVKDITISPTGEWLHSGFVRSPQQCLLNVDVALVVSHGAYGEGGILQRELVRHAVPYTGSDPFASAMTLNKLFTKKLLQGRSFALPRSVPVSKDSDYARVVQNIERLFGPHYIVKPVDSGSSFGVSRASGMPELLTALKRSFDTYSRVIVEEFIPGTEISVSATKDFRDQPLYIFPTVEVVPPADHSFFSQDAKENNLATYIAPARLSTAQKKRVSEAVREAYGALGLGHYARFDLIVTNDEVYLLEVNTQAQFQENTPFEEALESVGVAKHEFLQQLLQNARSNRLV